MKKLLDRTKNVIYKFSLSYEKEKWDKHPFHLNYESGTYRQAELISIIRDAVVYFALTPDELSNFSKEEEIAEASRAAWSRISKAKKDKKGDYGEVLLFLILSTFFPETKRFVTKVRLRSSNKEQIKGFDCAHFTVEDGKAVLWLGEAKFHKSFSTAITDAINSINDHLKTAYLKDEISILGQNIEVNKNDANFAPINEVLNGSKSIDDVKIRIPVLLTYDHEDLKNYSSIEDENFIKKMTEEFLKKFKNIENKELTTKQNFEVVFLLFPLESVDAIKKELEIIEEAHR